jgi:hypothetical protein
MAGRGAAETRISTTGRAARQTAAEEHGCVPKPQFIIPDFEPIATLNQRSVVRAAARSTRAPRTGMRASRRPLDVAGPQSELGVTTPRLFASV